MPPIPAEGRQRALRAELESLSDVVGAAPLVDLLLERSFELGATDIHFDPQADGLHVRMRLDGALHEVVHLKPNVAPQIISRAKLMAGIDITEKRLAQDGHISNPILRVQRDVRVGSGPTIHGERVVMRLMPDGTRFTELDQLGLEESQVADIRRALKSPFGVILSVGPVGSGKSTTTYSCLSLLNDPQLSLVTIEDPVERRIPGVNQIQIDTRIDFGFVQALRGVLRQDPNVIMVGEIRDAETAHIAIRAGLTGTRVLSTLHARDTGSTLDMFREFQVPRMFVADAVNCIIAQRLLRKVCTHDRETYRPDAAQAAYLKLTPEQVQSTSLVRGIPSDRNFQTGYSGRTAVFEVMFFTPEIREAVLAGKSGRTAYDLATQQGMLSLEQAAIRKALGGVTSLEEIHRVIAAD